MRGVVLSYGGLGLLIRTPTAELTSILLVKVNFHRESESNKPKSILASFKVKNATITVETTFTCRKHPLLAILIHTSFVASIWFVGIPMDPVTLSPIAVIWLLSQYVTGRMYQRVKR